MTPPASAAAGTPAAPSRPRTPGSHPHPLATNDLTSAQQSAVTSFAASEAASCSQVASFRELAVERSLVATTWQAPVLRFWMAGMQAGLPVGGEGKKEGGGWAKARERERERRRSRGRRRRAETVIDLGIIIFVPSVE